MTELTRAVRRSVRGIVREELVVSIYPSGLIGIRAKRTRREYTVPLATVYRLAVEAEYERRKAERRAVRGLRTPIKRGRL